MDPLPSTIAGTYTATPVPRKFPVPEGPPGPPAVDSALVGAPLIAGIQSLVDPVAANIAGLIRGGLAGAPDAIAAMIQAAPSVSQVLQFASAGLGAASLVSGVTGAAAQLLAAPTAAVPYLGAGTAAWAALAPPVTGALGLASAGFQALAQGSGALPSLSQWGQLVPQNPAMAIPPPPVSV